MGPYEQEPAVKFTIHEMTAADIDVASQMRMQSWIDTYVNPEVGITEQWITERFASQLAPENRVARVERFESAKKAGTFNGWVARNENNEIVGSTTPFIEADGSQRVGSIYVDKKWHGTGLGSHLMQRCVDWFNPEKPIYLEVVTYNERAKAFYRKWGFEEIPDSENLYDEKIPEVRMVRAPQNTIMKEST